MASLFVCKFMDLNTVSAQKYAKENDLSQYQAILTSRLFDNPYIIHLSSTNKTSHEVLYVRMMNSAVILWVLLKTGPRPTASDGPAARRPTCPRPTARRPMMAQRPGPDFPPFFVQRLIHTHAQVYIGFGHAKWMTASLNSFTIIMINNHFDPFRSFHSLHVATREKWCQSLFIRPFTKPEREEVLSQRCKLFSNHSLRLKNSYQAM